MKFRLPKFFSTIAIHTVMNTAETSEDSITLLAVGDTIQYSSPAGADWFCQVTHEKIGMVKIEFRAHDEILNFDDLDFLKRSLDRPREPSHA